MLTEGNWKMVWAVSKRSAWWLIYKNEDYAIHVCTTAFLNSVSSQLSRVARLWVPLLPVSLVWILPHADSWTTMELILTPAWFWGITALCPACGLLSEEHSFIHFVYFSSCLQKEVKSCPCYSGMTWSLWRWQLKKKLTLKLTGNVLLILDAQSDFIYVYTAKWLPWC